MNKTLILNFDKLILTGIGLAAVGVAISYADIYLFHIWFIIIGLVGLLKFKDSRYLITIKEGFNNHIVFLFFMFLWYSISIIWAPDIILSLKYLFYIFCGMIISITITQFSVSIEKFNRLYKLLYIIFIIELIIAILESFTPFRWPISPYSSSYQFFGKEAVDFLAFENPLSYSKFNPPTGFHWNTNNLALTMVLILPFFMCHKKLSIKLIGGIAITLISVLSASRAVFLALIFIYCIYLVIIKKKITTLLIIWMIIISTFWGMSNLRDSDNPRINELANSVEALELYLKGDIDIGGSIEWRRELIDNGINALIKTNGIGVGGGGSTALQKKAGGVAGRFTSMHNFWVEILVEGGIFFSIIGFMWYFSIIYNLFLISRNNKNLELNFYSQALLLSMIGFIPAAVAASSTIYFFPMWIMFGMSISVISLNKKTIIN